MSFIQNMDLNITNFIFSHLHNNVLDFLMPIFSKLNNGGFIWLLISFLLICNKKYRTIGFLTLIAVVMDFLIGEFTLKNIVQRARPFVSHNTIKLIISAPKGYSFPSGHSGSSFAAATILSIYFKKGTYLFFIFAFLIAFSRVYLGVHYFTDIVIGAILGIIIALLVNFVYKKYIYLKES